MTRLQLLFSWFIMSAARLPLPSMQALPALQREATRFVRLVLQGGYVYPLELVVSHNSSVTIVGLNGPLPCTMTRFSAVHKSIIPCPISVTDSGISTTASLALYAKAY